MQRLECAAGRTQIYKVQAPPTVEPAFYRQARSPLLLESVDIDPAQHVMGGVLELRTLLLIGWFAHAARRWFPPGAETYDGEIAGLIEQLGVRHLG